MFFLHTEQRGEEGEESYENPDQTPPTGKEAEILAHMWGGALYMYRVLDPHSFMQIRIQHFQNSFNPDSDADFFL